MPLDRNDRIRLIQRAENLERASKAKGKRDGVIGQSGLGVLRCLLFRYHSVTTQRCSPSYTAIQRATGYALATIAGALHRLERAGLLVIQRRRIRLADGTFQQLLNLYGFARISSPEWRITRELVIRNQPAVPDALQAALDRLGAAIRARSAIATPP